MLTVGADDWRERAACARVTGISFFPAPNDAAEISRAKAVCFSCGVREACLLFALETEQPDGIWGGSTPKERSRMRRQLLAEA